MRRVDHLRLDRLGDGTDLVDLEEETVAGGLLDGHLDALGVGDRKVVTDHLDLGGLVEVDPRGEVVLVEGVLDRANVVLLNVRVVEGSELLAGDPLGLVRVGVLRQSAAARALTLGQGQKLTLKSRSYLPSL